MPETPHLAVLIDADNVSPERLPGLLAEVARYGDASVRRMYGDWTSDQLKGWKTAANVHAIKPIQQFAYTTGKNATDGALIIDAMDLLYTGRFDGFCIVSSDSDFTGLASRLRESGATVYGFGERKTPQAFVNACNRFIYLDVVDQPAVDDADATTPAPAAAADKPEVKKALRDETRLVALLRSGIRDASEEDGWAHLGAVGSLIRQQAPDFDSRNWGFAKLGDLVAAIGLFTVKREKSVGGGTTIRVKDERPKAK